MVLIIPQGETVRVVNMITWGETFQVVNLRVTWDVWRTLDMIRIGSLRHHEHNGLKPGSLVAAIEMKRSHSKLLPPPVDMTARLDVPSRSVLITSPCPLCSSVIDGIFCFTKATNEASFMMSEICFFLMSWSRCSCYMPAQRCWKTFPLWKFPSLCTHSHTAHLAKRSAHCVAALIDDASRAAHVQSTTIRMTLPTRMMFTRIAEQFWLLEFV